MSNFLLSKNILEFEFEKIEYCQKWDFEIVNFEKMDIFKIWIWIKYGFLPLCVQNPWRMIQEKWKHDNIFDSLQVVLETEITNKPALRLYENLGFVRDKRLFRYYLNGVDALRLKLWLRWLLCDQLLLCELLSFEIMIVYKELMLCVEFSLFLEIHKIIGKRAYLWQFV